MVGYRAGPVWKVRWLLISPPPDDALLSMSACREGFVRRGGRFWKRQSQRVVGGCIICPCFVWFWGVWCGVVARMATAEPAPSHITVQRLVFFSLFLCEHPRPRRGLVAQLTAVCCTPPFLFGALLLSTVRCVEVVVRCPMKLFYRAGQVGNYH